MIRLPDTLARLLLLLIRANGEIVDKDTIAAQLWPGRDISDNYVTQQIYMLRQLLGEQAKDRGYVVMVRGRGYRFVR
ncbi:MAG: winged helix-turn-helix domain-containing protein, partial [Candidatus Cybelea sp.]